MEASVSLRQDKWFGAGFGVSIAEVLELAQS